MTLTVENILDEEVRVNFQEGITLRQYVFRAFHELWTNSEDFTGYRLFGNSGWEWEEVCEPIAERHNLTGPEVYNMVTDALKTEFPF